MRRIILLALLVFSFTNCSEDHLFDCLKSTGDEITENRQVTPFTKINMKDDVDIVLYADTTFFIRVTAGEHLIDGIITELENGTLYIRNENRCNWTRSFSNKYTVVIGMKDPEKIDVYGSGNITSADSIRTEEFTCDSWNASGSFNFIFSNTKCHFNNNVGRADFHATGKTLVTFAYINDVGTLDCSNLNTELFYIKSSSTGDCKVKVEKELEAEIAYTGNVYYTGNLYREKRTGTGSGQLIRY